MNDADKVEEIEQAEVVVQPLGKILFDLGYLSQQKLDAALILQTEKPHDFFGNIVINANFATRDQVIEALYKQNTQRLGPDAELSEEIMNFERALQEQEVSFEEQNRTRRKTSLIPEEDTGEYKPAPGPPTPVPTE